MICPLLPVAKMPLVDRECDMCGRESELLMKTFNEACGRYGWCCLDCNKILTNFDELSD